MPSPLVIIVVVAKLLGLVAGWVSGSAAVVLWGFFVPDVVLFYQVFVPGARWMCDVTRRFEPVGPEVWLTIDDGPDPEDTPRLLDLLDQHGARATFFMIGERAACVPALVAEVTRRGHEVAAHTMTHPARTFWLAGSGRTQREIEENLVALRPAGAPVRAFRAPAGIKSLFLGPVLVRHGLRCIAWSVRAYDARSHQPQRVAARVLRQVRPGSIILMHEGPGVPAVTRVAAIDLVLKGLTARGLRCVVPGNVALFGGLGPTVEIAPELVDDAATHKK